MSERTYGYGQNFDSATYYSTSDTIEHLDHESVEDALEDFLDNGGELPVRVFAWARKPRPTTLSGEHIEAMFQSIEEWQCELAASAEVTEADARRLGIEVQR